MYVYRISIYVKLTPFSSAFVIYLDVSERIGYGGIQVNSFVT